MHKWRTTAPIFDVPTKVRLPNIARVLAWGWGSFLLVANGMSLQGQYQESLDRRRLEEAFNRQGIKKG